MLLSVFWSRSANKHSRISAMESIRKELQTGALTAATPPGRHKLSSARFIIAIVVFFLACNVVKAYLIFRIMFVSDTSDNLALLVTVLLVANSAANPLVYAFLKRDIKRELTRLICVLEHNYVKPGNRLRSGSAIFALKCRGMIYL